MSLECTKCGACCVAPDISSLGKPLGLRCPNLILEGTYGAPAGEPCPPAGPPAPAALAAGAPPAPRYLCAVYENRPQICRDYAADWLCERIAAPTLDERVRKYLAVFDLQPAQGVQIVQIARAANQVSASVPNRT